eukprot:500622-Rhodomonas_salina.2
MSGSDILHGAIERVCWTPRHRDHCCSRRRSASIDARTTSVYAAVPLFMLAMPAFMLLVCTIYGSDSDVHGRITAGSGAEFKVGGSERRYRPRLPRNAQA